MPSVSFSAQHNQRMGKDSHECPLIPHRWEWMKSDLPLASLTILRRHKLFNVSVMGARRERADRVNCASLRQAQLVRNKPRRE